MADISVRDIMRHDVVILAPTDSVARVAKAMADSGLAGLPVVENGEIIGIVTDKNIIAREADLSEPAIIPFLDRFFVLDAGSEYDEDVARILATDARGLMTHPVINIRESATLEETATVMIDRNVGVLPVVDPSNTIVGIVTRQDLVRIIAKLENDSSTD